MALKNVQVRVAAVLELAARQHGVISRAQLMALGMNSDGIQYRIRKGKLHPVYPGVYAVGRPELTTEGRWMAAVLACGDGAVLSHASAGELWEVGEPTSSIEVTVPAQRHPRTAGIRIHRRDLGPDEISEHAGILVTFPLLTLIDLAATSSARAVEAAIANADRLDLIDPESLRAALDHCPRRPGVGVLKALLDRDALVLTDSELERLFVPIAIRAGLPKPLTQQWVNGYRVDFFWPDLGLVVETDGLRYHRTPAQQARDRLRDQAHTAAGLTPLRFSHAQVAREPGHVEAILRRTARRLAGPN